jgi:hypothetical protein
MKTFLILILLPVFSLGQTSTITTGKFDTLLNAKELRYIHIGDTVHTTPTNFFIVKKDTFLLPRRLFIWAKPKKVK